MQRRNWVPDVVVIADQIVADYRDDEDEASFQGDLDAIATMESWQATAQDHGDEFREDDWLALVQELARRVAYPHGAPTHHG
jgi:hypothetical protein